MKLHELKPAAGSNVAAKRKGRGHGKFEAGAVVDTKALVEAGLIKKSLDGVKVLGNGELTKALTVQLAAYTATAKEKIEKAGGKAEVI